MDGIIPNVNDSMAGLHQALQAATDRIEQQELALQEEIEKRLPEIFDNVLSNAETMSIEEMLTHSHPVIRRLGIFLQEREKDNVNSKL